MTSHIEGLEELQANMDKIAKRYGEAVADAAQASAQLVRSSAIRSIQRQSSGHEVTRYRSGGGSYAHIASAPYKAPNTDTGRLASSVQVETRGGAVFVGSTLEYAGHLELGTMNMEPRPWLIPALEGRRREIHRLFKAAAEPRGKA